MENRVAMIGIIVEANGDIDVMNALLHEYRNFIVGRMGVPYAKRGIAMISVMIDAPQDKIAALSGKLGALANISSKTLYSNVKEVSDENLNQ